MFWERFVLFIDFISYTHSVFMHTEIAYSWYYIEYPCDMQRNGIYSKRNVLILGRLPLFTHRVQMESLIQDSRCTRACLFISQYRLISTNHLLHLWKVERSPGVFLWRLALSASSTNSSPLQLLCSTHLEPPLSFIPRDTDSPDFSTLKCHDLTFLLHRVWESLHFI